MMQKDRDLLILPPLLTIVSFVALFFFRSVDDNRLTSWQWVFRHGNAAGVFVILVAGCGFITLLAWLSRWRRSPRGPLPFPHELTIARRFPAAMYVGRVAPFVIFLVYFLCVMFFWRMPEVNIDSSRYFTQAKYLELFGVRYFLSEWGREIHSWTDMPLIPFFYGVIFRFFGESRLYTQLFTTSLFALTGVLTFKTGQALWDEETGIYGAVFLLCIPYLYTQIPLMLVDVPVMFLLLLAIFAVIRALKRGGLWIAAASLSIFFTFLSKYSAWLMLSVLPVMVFVFTLRSEEPAKKTCLVRAALTFSASLVFMGLFILVYYDVIGEQIRLLMSYQKPALKRWGESFFSTFLFQTHPFLTASAFVSIYAAFMRRDWKYLIIFWLVLLVVLLQIRRIRYIIMIFPLLALMASYGLRSVKGIETRVVIISCALMSSLVLAVTAYLPFLQELSMVNLKKAGEFLDTCGSSHIGVHVIQPIDPTASLLVAVPIMDIFTRKTLIVDERSAAGRNADEAESSPLRFTWEFKNPSYYSTAEISTDIDTVAVISDSAGDQLPSYLDERLYGFQLVKSFDDYEGIFSFRTSVRIYEKRGDECGL
ncbi:MAG: hypothetical protein H6R43_468 [Nitrospirae bacterium]|nr:hypothetical protein [Nitrospirota bacterium]